MKTPSPVWAVITAFAGLAERRALAAQLGTAPGVSILVLGVAVLDEHLRFVMISTEACPLRRLHHPPAVLAHDREEGRFVQDLYAAVHVAARPNALGVLQAEALPKHLLRAEHRVGLVRLAAQLRS